MHRRQLFRSLLLPPAAAFLLNPHRSSEATTSPAPAAGADPILYRGYELRWTGWKPSLDSATFVGQWLARSLAGRPWYLYVNVPGFIGGVYYPGHVFSLASPDHRHVHYDTPDSIRDDYRNTGLLYLAQLVFHLGDQDLPHWYAPLFQLPVTPDEIPDQLARARLNAARMLG